MAGYLPYSLGFFPSFLEGRGRGELCSTVCFMTLLNFLACREGKGGGLGLEFICHQLSLTCVFFFFFFFFFFFVHDRITLLEQLKSYDPLLCLSQGILIWRAPQSLTIRFDASVLICHLKCLNHLVLHIIYINFFDSKNTL